MAKALRIANWPDYEKADSKKCTTMKWVAVPINHSGLGYLEMISRPDGVRMIGGWLLMLQLAALCPTRGLLVTDSGRIMGAKEIALKTRANEQDISDCIKALLELSWLEEVEISGDRPEGVRKVSGLQDRTGTGQDRTKQDITGQDNAGATPPEASEHPPSITLKNSPPCPGPALPEGSGEAWFLGLSDGSKAFVESAVYLDRKNAANFRRDLDTAYGLVHRYGLDHVIATGRRMVKLGKPPYASKVRQALIEAAFKAAT